MTYQAIARKWRPQRFDDLVGQEAIARTLQNALRQRRWHHAYIFAGPRGVGKTTTARLFAKALNCHRGPTPEPCAECPPCREIAEGRALDVLEIDAASHTGVDNVRQVIIDTLALGPARDRYRIFIIDEFHQLSSSAFNALLKTLEEPPPHVLFLMATTELHKVPATILSRCQIFEFRLIPEKKIAERLRHIADVEGISISDSALRKIARAGRGSMRDAQSVLEQVISFAEPGHPISDETVAAALGMLSADVLGAVVEALAECDSSRLLRLIEEVSARGYDERHFCRDLMGYARNVLVAKVVGRDPELLPVSDGEIVHLLRHAQRFSEEDLVRIIHALAEAEQTMRYASDPRLLLEASLVRLAHMQRVRPLAQVIRSLEDLERRLERWPHGSATPPLSRAEAPRAAQNAPVTAVVEDGPTGRHRTGDPEDAPARRHLAGDPEVERVKEALRDQGKMLLLGALDRAKTIEITGETLRIVLPAHLAPSRETLSDRTAIQTIEAAARQALGRALKIQVLLEEEKAPSPQEERARALVENDPIVTAFVTTFKGEIVDVLTPEPESPTPDLTHGGRR